MGNRVSRFMAQISIGNTRYGGYTAGRNPTPLGLGRPPVVFVLGATGTGKSKLAIAIAEKFGGEIISADSMQIYKELDIVTNKVTEEEIAACQHHLIDLVDPLKEDHNVLDFQKEASSVIQRLLDQGKLPVIVGGTNYYIESLLWKVLIKRDSYSPKCASDSPMASQSLADKTAAKDIGLTKSYLVNAGEACCQGSGNLFASANATGKEGPADGHLPMENANTEPTPQTSVSDSDRATDPGVTLGTNSSSAFEHAVYSGQASEPSVTAEMPAQEAAQRLDYALLKDHINLVDSHKLYKVLTGVDPVKARTIHPHTIRKVIRALEVYQQSGRTMSSIHAQQRLDAELSPSAHLGAPLRYPNPVAFWIQCEESILKMRLDERVGVMLKKGLMNELVGFHKEYNLQRAAAGGLPDYTRGIFQAIGFKEFHPYLTMTDEEMTSTSETRVFNECLASFKSATRKYSNYQIRWIRKRLLMGPPPELLPPLFGLDATDLAKWTENVESPCLSILGNIYFMLSC